MPWLAIDDTFHAHRKVKRLRRKDRVSAIGLWTLAGSWCANQVNDGEVPDYMLDEFAASPRIAGLLVEVDLWDEVDGGYRFHDWLDYQPSREEVMADRLAKHEAKAKAGRAGGIASGVARRRNTRSSVEADPKQDEAQPNQNEPPSLPLPTPPVNPGSVSDSTHQGARPAGKSARGINVGGEWVNARPRCPIHQDEEISPTGTCTGCEADRKASA